MAFNRIHSNILLIGKDLLFSGFIAKLLPLEKVNKKKKNFLLNNLDTLNRTKIYKLTKNVVHKYCVPSSYMMKKITFQCIVELENRRSMVRSMTWPIFFLRIDDNHCQRIHSYLTTVHCFDYSYVGKASSGNNIVQNTD